MKFARPKTILFTNNKGGVGKTTMTFEVGCKLADEGYSVLLIDADPQCNLTTLALGESYYNDDLFLENKKKSTLWDVIKPVAERTGVADFTIKPTPTTYASNLDILPGSIELGLGEASFFPQVISEAQRGERSGYEGTSVLYRYIWDIASNKYDFVLIDSSPSLGSWNQILALTADGFVVIMKADIFSIKAIETLGAALGKWKRTWETTAKSMVREGKDIPSSSVIPAKSLFLGYIINNFKVYNDVPASAFSDVMKLIPQRIEASLSEHHTQNGLYKKSVESLGDYQDAASIAPLSISQSRPQYTISDTELHKGSQEVREKLKNSIDDIVKKLIERATQYL